MVHARGQGGAAIAAVRADDTRCEPMLTALTLSVTIRTVRTRHRPLRAQHFQAVVPGGASAVICR